MQKWGNFEPLYLSNESKFLKIKKKAFLVYGLRNVSLKFQTSAMIRKYRSGQAEQLVLLYVQKRGKFEPLYAGNESTF